MVWFTLVFLVLLKIPLVYLCYVVWWAVKDPPAGVEGLGPAGGGTAGSDPGWWHRGSRGRVPSRGGPHGSPARRTVVPARRRAPA